MRYAGPLASDPLGRARELAQLHSATFCGDDVSGQLRSVIRESWQRSLHARIDPDRRTPSSHLPTDELREQRQAHPFAPMLPMLREALLGEADEAPHIMIITNTDGHILWREGSSPVQRDADSVCLSEGTRWSEDSIGTNAMGTALATGRPVQIHSAEHLVRTYHSWTCAASPVHDPDTGALLGTLDISGPLQTMHPALLALASTSARLVESQLRLRMNARDDALRERHAHHIAKLPGGRGAVLSPTGRVLTCEPHAWLDDGQRIALDAETPIVLDGGERAEIEPLSGGGYLLRARPHSTSAPPEPSTLSLSLLGDEVPSATVGGQRLDLTLRHAEILALLVMHPGGLTAEQLALLLHGESGNPTSTRVEIHRLRNHVGQDVVRTKPYQITAKTTCDFDTVRDALRHQDTATAAENYRGLLLPRSESPKIRDEREELLAAYRSSLLSAGSVEPLWRFALTDAGHDDVEVLEELRALLAADDPRVGTVRNRLRRLLGQDQ